MQWVEAVTCAYCSQPMPEKTGNRGRPRAKYCSNKCRAKAQYAENKKPKMKAVIAGLVFLSAPGITTQPGPGPHPPLAPTSSVSITRSQAEPAQALAAPQPTHTPYTWLEAHCGTDEDHPAVVYPDCKPVSR